MCVCVKGGGGSIELERAVARSVCVCVCVKGGGGSIELERAVARLAAFQNLI